MVKSEPMFRQPATSRKAGAFRILSFLIDLEMLFACFFRFEIQQISLTADFSRLANTPLKVLF